MKNGTNVNLRGVKVGQVHRISIQYNKVIVLLRINSLKILIPKNSVVEANQIGLFNDIVIDITPIDDIDYRDANYLNLRSQKCLISQFICPNFYIKGYKGMNYDDLVRATTRISQRFDDPHFFSLFYLFLHNGINISDEIINLINDSSHLLYLLSECIPIILLKYVS